MLKYFLHKKKRILYLIGGVLILWFVFCLPKPLFEDPTSTVIEDQKGQLLSAKIAKDGQWRFPVSDSIPDKFISAITQFEDAYFFKHPGVNPISIFRALRQNFNAGKVVSGGSTISMQTIRLSRKGKSRTMLEKTIEIFQTLRMEFSYSKDEILKMYCAQAPFGGNIVGLETASWRYFGRSPYQLSWGEICTLAVLPNAPSLIYPGKNQEKLLKKRNRLLDKLLENGKIGAMTCELAKAESLPGAPNPIPMLAPHLLDRTIKEGNDGKRISSTIDLELQQEVNRIVDYYHSVLENNEIHNIAALVLDVEKGTVLAYTGNSTCKEEGSGIAVDIIRAPRSTGSILKPFLYNFMLEEGTLLPHSLVPDIPTHIGGFSPKNFERSYDGVVPASEALARSLNIPAVKMLQEYGLEKFLYKIQSRGFSTIDKTSSHYGLSLILGGAEATLWDLSNEYMQMSQALLNTKTGRANYISTNSKEQEPKTEMTYDPAATWWTFEAMTSLNRPYQEIGWQKYKSAQKIAWKTGTSFGHRDAWAIGMTPKHVVGVWVGNADGEGRPGLTGLSSAAPILFKIIKHLPYKNWFQEPYMDLISVITCKESGFLASKACENVVELMVPENGENSTLCSYHTYIHLDAKMEYRVESNCYPVSDMKTKSWFVLPPVQEWYYKKRDPFYKVLPAYTPDCQPDRMNNMAVIYPQQRAKIFVPRQLDGTKGKAVFEITHRDNESTVYWHLDDNYVGNTRTLHKFELAPEVGTHIMTLVDEKGESLHWNFEVIEK